MMPAPDSVAFADVAIRLTRQIYYSDENAFQLEVRQAPAPLPGGPFQVDLDSRLDRFRRIFAQYVAQNQFFYRYELPAAGTGLEQDLTELGGQLYELLPEPFRQAFPGLMQTVFGQGRGLRLTVEARAGDKADRLLSLPWELLFLEEARLYPARSPRFLIVRRLLGAVRRSPARPAPPFNVTHLIAHHPADPPTYRIDETLQQVERASLAQAIRPGRYRLVDRPGSVEQMLAALREESSYVVHFLGHGEILEGDETEGAASPIERGYLRFISAGGEAQWVSGEQLHYMLSFTPTVQLVVLNACHGGTSAAPNIALELVYSGLPNVVAIQSDILQEAAGRFIRAFYTELQRGSPIEYAVAVGRAMISANMPQILDWCLPVLYTNAGLEPAPPVVRTAAYLWQWAGHPKAQQWAGLTNLLFGLLHLIVGLLLLLSRAAPSAALPADPLLDVTAGTLAALPFLLTAAVYLARQLSRPPGWPASSRAALALHSFASVAIGLGLPGFYGWLLLLLLAGMGFLSLLSPLAEVILLGLLFAPGVLLGYSQLLGHSRAFVANARLQAPTFDWSILFIVVAGYILLLLPWLVLRFLPALLGPPWGNLGVGIGLVVFGYLLLRGSRENQGQESL